MNFMMKWTVFFAFLMLFINPSHSFTALQKGRVNGPAIHSTYFLTPNNQGFDVRATAYPGTWVNGSCVYAEQYHLGQDFIKTGDRADLDAYQLKAVVGGGYSCLTIVYHYQQPVVDVVQLGWDGLNYTTTIPATTEVTIL